MDKPISNIEHPSHRGVTYKIRTDHGGITEPSAGISHHEVARDHDTRGDPDKEGINRNMDKLPIWERSLQFSDITYILQDFLPQLFYRNFTFINKMEIIYWTCGGVDNMVSLLIIKNFEKTYMMTEVPQW